ncbi:MAG TPA: hypothetical protein VGD47_01070 [Steroidobacteraceae bacterium]
MHADPPDLERFVRGEVDAADFPHHEHVRMGFEMLRRHDFAETVWHFSRALRAMTARAGKPQAFNQTVTIAFLSVIAERMECEPAADFAAFAHDNPDVFDRAALARWYRPERLGSQLARRTFLLPEPNAPPAPARATPRD